ncbi:unnamed protein product [Paramecium sonneborni]|uniref:Roadblock/LAMTOR2 domain-containing protein n=1 Tax=Paramecium sonneborni TaxID=65129 RepID=A0A8S1NGL9_9CILI|nr:unnamed protein product [Paramecium sonneborni]
MSDVDIEDTINRIKNHKSVQGIVIVNSEGVITRTTYLNDKKDEGDTIAKSIPIFWLKKQDLQFEIQIQLMIQLSQELNLNQMKFQQLLIKIFYQLLFKDLKNKEKMINDELDNQLNQSNLIKNLCLAIIYYYITEQLQYSNVIYSQCLSIFLYQYLPKPTLQQT